MATKLADTGLKLGYWFESSDPPGPPTAWRMYNPTASGGLGTASWAILADTTQRHLFNSVYALADHQFGQLKVEAGARYVQETLPAINEYNTAGIGNVSYSTALSQSKGIIANRSVGSFDIGEFLPFLALTYPLHHNLDMLVLGGVISSALFSSLLSLVKYLADPYNQLPTIVYWLMGSLAMADLHQVAWLAPPMVLAMGLLLLCGRALDALSMGDDEALALGVPVTAIRATVIFAATLISALTVSLAGIIGWVGLIIPHIARLMVGPGNARLLPVSTLLGAIFLLAADALSRSLNTTEIPIGIVTELLGIPCFLLVLHRVRRGWA